MERVYEAMEEGNTSSNPPSDDVEHHPGSIHKHGRYPLGHRLFDNTELLVAFNNFIRSFDGDLNAAIREFATLHGYEEDGGND